MKKVITGIAIVAMAALSLSADVYIKSKTHTDAVTMMGQTTPASDAIGEAWLSDNVFYNKTGDNAVLIDLAKNTFMMINYSAKTYVESPLPLDMTKLLPPEAAAMAAMLVRTATVTPSGETKKIGTWNCQGYTQTVTVMGMPMTTKIWATTDLPFDWAKFSGKFLPAVTKSSFLDDASIKEMAKIKGYMISSETNAEMMGAKIHVTIDVTEISTKTAPAGIYSAPAGFTKTAALDMNAFRR